jgi:hypothetical protein
MRNSNEFKTNDLEKKFMKDTRQFVEDVAWQVVAQVAPEEIGIFELLLAVYLAEPTPPDLSITTQHDPTSMGLDEVLVAVTPAVVAAVEHSLSYLGTTTDAQAWQQTFSYERGLQHLLNRIPSHHHRYADLLLFQAQLMENLAQVRRYGDTADSRADRFRIIEQLNHFSLEVTGQSFNSLCGMASGFTSSQWQHMRQGGIQEAKRFGIQDETLAEQIAEAMITAFLTVLWGDIGGE